MSQLCWRRRSANKWAHLLICSAEATNRSISCTQIQAENSSSVLGLWPQRKSNRSWALESITCRNKFSGLNQSNIAQKDESCSALPQVASAKPQIGPLSSSDQFGISATNKWSMQWWSTWSPIGQSREMLNDRRNWRWQRHKRIATIVLVELIVVKASEKCSKIKQSKVGEMLTVDDQQLQKGSADQVTDHRAAN